MLVYAYLKCAVAGAYPHADSIQGSNGKKRAKGITEARCQFQDDEKEQIGNHEVFASITVRRCLISACFGLSKSCKAPTDLRMGL